MVCNAFDQESSYHRQSFRENNVKEGSGLHMGFVWRWNTDNKLSDIFGISRSPYFCISSVILAER